MTDAELWRRGVAGVETDYLVLPSAVRSSLRKTVEAVKSCKLALQLLADKASCGDSCALCRGACCRSGKYHFTVVDLLVFLVDGIELFSPRFDQGVCPYLGANGCLMSPSYRPFNCIIFICDSVEERLSPEDVDMSRRFEKELRSHYEAVESLFARRFMHGLLINSEREIVGGSGTILGRDVTAASTRLT